MQRLVHIADDGARRRLDHLDDAPSDGWLWLDVADPKDVDLTALAKMLGLDRVSTEDLFEDQSPRFEVLDSYWLVIVHALALDSERLRTVEVDLLVSDRWLVTVHEESVSSIDFVESQILDRTFTADNPHHLAVRLVEFVGERYLLLLDDLDAQILDLEDQAVEGDPSVLPDIHALRRDVGVLRRVLVPQRRMLDVLGRRDFGLSDRTRRDLSDALDHHVRLVDSLDSAHQMVATVLDTYRGATAEKMNEVMKVLTVFSALFMPLTFLAGIYGMNFDNMPELAKEWAYPACLGAMVVIALSLWVYFVRRGFIGGPTIRELARPAKAAGRVGRGLASAAATPLRVTSRAFSGNEK